jgi:hypothetical protein
VADAHWAQCHIDGQGVHSAFGVSLLRTTDGLLHANRLLFKRVESTAKPCSEQKLSHCREFALAHTPEDPWHLHGLQVSQLLLQLPKVVNSFFMWYADQSDVSQVHWYLSVYHVPSEVHVLLFARAWSVTPQRGILMTTRLVPLHR